MHTARGTPVERRDIERFLAVGKTVIFHAEPNRETAPRFKSAIRGWRKGSHVLLDRLKTPDGNFVTVHAGQPCVVRFLHEGHACAFDSAVIDWDSRRSSPYMRLMWPKEFKHACFRKFERVKVQAPCSVSVNGQNWEGELRDLSIGGCGLEAGMLVAPKETVLLSFDLPDGALIRDIQAVVRSERKMNTGLFLGCEFASGQEAVEGDIAFFVTASLNQCRAEGPNGDPRPRVLVMDDDRDRCTKLRRKFEQGGCEVFLASNVVDGMLRLRMTPPAVLLASESLQDLAGTEVCRIVKMSPYAENLKVYVYGGEGEGIERRTQQAKADGYFPPGKTMVPDIVFDISQALTQAK